MPRTRFPRFRPALGLLVLIALMSPGASAPTANADAMSALDLLSERTEHSLRGVKISLDDQWNSARLLAHFGENRLAYDVLNERGDAGVIDAQVERFEARLLTELNWPARADSILALQAYSGGERAYYLLCLRRARLNLEAGRLQRALGFLDLIESPSILEAHRDYLRMQALSRLKRLEEAWTVGEARLARGIPVSLSPAFEQLLLDTYIEGRQYEKAVDLIRVLKKRRGGSSKLGPVLAREVDVLFEMGDTLSAVTTAAALLSDKRTRRFSVDIADNVVHAVSPSQFTDDALLDFTHALLGAENLEGADRTVQELDRRSLNKDQRERLRLYSGDLYYQERRYSKSYGFVRDHFDDDGLERNAMLMRARIYRKTGQAGRSADTYVEFARIYPYDAKAAEALFVASDLYLRSADRKRSIETLERAVDVYPSRKHGRMATRRLAAYYIDRKHYAMAVAILEKAIERTGRSSDELLYSLADAYGHMGKKEKQTKLLEEIRALNGESYYLKPEVPESFARPILNSDGRVALRGERGLLRFLKNVFDEREGAMTTIRQTLAPLPVDDTAIEERSPYLIRGRYFLQMGFRDWAEDELSVLESSGNVPAKVWFELGALYDDYAMHWRSVRAFQRVYYSLRRDVRHSLQQQFDLLMYPMPYPAEIVENCVRYDISPHLVYAMMRRESLFDSNAVSRAGAMGLMQLMPSTSEEVAGRLGFPAGVSERLFSPEINLTFGIWYAANLLKRTDGNAPMMLSAYNAGYGNARRWFRGARDPIDALENIDYTETRDYVKAIVESSRIYHDHYFSPDAAGSKP